ncbi:hypothetical protein GPECTOR_43g955 [Gonium pectorale]|uniref:Uncharacterized protein n=1 Tax=Gonium pectorale TaxID=33097 RepID=A0A150G9L1_GONPE|nr:hypothetical protein GPECTOR_43g955 [Gonium pectorale]|eukprot:KXZ46518.1 hypothetical protein GPECTOR_43g955 [Gonium pectorale]
MALSAMRVGAAPRAAVSRPQTVQVVARGSWRESSTVTATPAGRSSSAANRVSPTRSVLPANWRQELESLRNGNGNGSSAAAAPAPAPARSASASWRDAPAAAAPARPSSSPKKAVTPSRSSLPANWKQELEALRGGSSSSSASWRTESAPAAAPARSGSKKAVTPSRSSLPANWKQELESMRSASPAPSSAPAAPARSSSASWRSESGSSSSSAAADKAGTNPWTGKAKVEIKRTALPADWRKGL